MRSGTTLCTSRFTRRLGRRGATDVCPTNISARVPLELHEATRIEAEEQGVTISELVRRGLTSVLSRSASGHDEVRQGGGSCLSSSLMRVETLPMLSVTLIGPGVEMSQTLCCEPMAMRPP